MLNLIEGAKRQLLESEYFPRVKKCFETTFFPLKKCEKIQEPGSVLEKTEKLIIYGLGSLEQPGAVHIRYQVALACLLSTLLPNLSAPPQTYDPVFTALDKVVLNTCGFDIIDRNENGRRAVTGYTLFYMPHCEPELTENLIDANWSMQMPKDNCTGTKSNLFEMAIFGNSFKKYLDRWNQQSNPGHERTSERILVQLHQYFDVLEKQVDDTGFDVIAAFNDMSMHVIHPK